MEPGQRNLITDVPGLFVGNAHDRALKSGVTCLTGAAPFVAGVDIRGGAPGTREIGLLAPDKVVAEVDALVLSGGSAFGLDAASGVVAGLRAAGRGHAVGPHRVPIVPAAILFDLTSGVQDWTDNPYPALGRRAYDAAGADFTLGSVGAGTGAETARWKGGLGSASARLASGHTVGALVAVNPVGCVTPPGSRYFWAWADEQGSEYGGLGAPPDRPRPLTAADTKIARRMSEAGNTTIAIVATDALLDKGQATRMAIAAHDGMARAIQPSHTPHDGDLVFAAATGARPLVDPLFDPLMLGHAAAVTLARAIARAVFEATSTSASDPPDAVPAYRDRG